MIKKCEICGAEFETGQYKEWRIYCSPECYKESKRRCYKLRYAKLKRGLIPPPPKERTCPICGATFKVTRHQGSRIYCSVECRRKAANAKQRARRAADPEKYHLYAKRWRWTHWKKETP